MRAIEFLRSAEAAQQAYELDLSELVGIDSGSNDVAGVNRVADWVQRRLLGLGFTVERRASAETGVGDTLIGRRSGTGAHTVLMFAHMDTVFDIGDAAARPFSVDADGLAHGPGVTDDKAGVVAGLHAAAHLIANEHEPYKELVFVCTPDEEIGSSVGGPVLQELAETADVAFCLECARENGDLVISRKGAVDLDLEVLGKAAHSGIEPERGAHAGLEAAHLTIFLQELADPENRLTVNVGILRAGDRTNIVPDRALLRVEARAPLAATLAEMMQKLQDRADSPVVAGTTISVTVVDDCPPLEETAHSKALGAMAVGIASELGFQPGLARTGGVSDANRVAVLGVPTLDGLGPVGGGDHTPTEWLDLGSVPQRVALLATLIARSQEIL